MKSLPLIGLVLLFLSAPSLAQTNLMPEGFTQHNWTQIRPDFGYLNGCTTGYRAFSFGRDSYFIFNRNIHGSWRITPQGNLILRTKNGQRIILSIAGSTLTYTTSNVAPGSEWIAPIPRSGTARSGDRGNLVEPRPVAPGLPAWSAPSRAPSAPPPGVPITSANPSEQIVASGYLQFRNGDLFQECTK